MPTFGVPKHHRHLSRLGFYLGVLIVLWVLGRLEAPLTGSSTMLPGSAMSDEELGVAPAYIASPVHPDYAKLPQGR